MPPANVYSDADEDDDEDEDEDEHDDEQVVKEQEPVVHKPKLRYFCSKRTKNFLAHCQCFAAH